MVSSFYIPNIWTYFQFKPKKLGMAKKVSNPFFRCHMLAKKFCSQKPWSDQKRTHFVWFFNNYFWKQYTKQNNISKAYLSNPPCKDRCHIHKLHLVHRFLDHCSFGQHCTQLFDKAIQNSKNVLIIGSFKESIPEQSAA